MATMLSAKEIALALETDPRTLRKFFRSDASPIERVGKGSRYTVEASKMRSIKSKFAKWDAERIAAKATEGDDGVTEGDDA